MDSETVRSVGGALGGLGAAGDAARASLISNRI
jgi:hypothetical protein